MSKCIFCDIASHKIDAKIIYEDELVVGFQDVAPQAPVHILVIPKRHVEKLSDLKKDEASVWQSIFTAIQNIVEQQKLINEGYRVVVNEGKNAGQAVFHLHFHVLGGRALRWPPG